MEHSVTFGYGTIRTQERGETEIVHGIQPAENETDINPIYVSGPKTGLFGGANTWDDWHLIPVSRPEIVPPEVYTNYVDLPAVHGKLDLSEYLTGGPVYKNRSGSLEFYAANGYHFWAETYNEICNLLHGKRMFMVLEDEPEYFYEGRFRVQKWNSDGKTNWSTVVIDYELNPFKFIIPTKIITQGGHANEYWERFLFEDIHPYEFMKVNAAEGKVFSIPGYTHGFMLDAVIDEDSTLPASATIQLNDRSMTISKPSATSLTSRSGTLYPVSNTNNTITVTGTGTIDLVFYGGHL